MNNKKDIDDQYARACEKPDFDTLVQNTQNQHGLKKSL